MKRLKRFILIILLLVVLVSVLITLKHAGTFLVRRDTPAKADAVVMLMGGVAPDRILECADVYAKGLAPRLILVKEGMGPYLELERRGVHIRRNSDQAREALITLGIPAGSITLLNGDARSTQQEATIIREYLKAQTDIDTITLVTSADHTRRASMIFEKAFKKQDLAIVVQSSPSKYTSYTGIGWWKSKEGIQTVLMEYLKMANFWLFDKRKL